MPRALSPCSTPGCPELTASGRCDQHRRQAERDRGTARQRGYDRRHERVFRRGVLERDPLCVCTTCAEHGPRCLAPSTVADHYPLDRRDLVARAMNPNDPAHGRGLCKPCHDRSTGRRQPGGWHAQR